MKIAAQDGDGGKRYCQDVGDSRDPHRPACVPRAQAIKTGDGFDRANEMGPLITAIIVAGRSGAAIAAEVATMQVSEEIDAMRTIGLDPMEVLVLPRTFALIIAMPLLAVYADLMGLAFIGILASMAGAYYYLRVIVVMYMKERRENAAPTQGDAWGVKFALSTAALATLFLGFAPSGLLDQADEASDNLVTRDYQIENATNNLVGEQPDD